MMRLRGILASGIVAFSAGTACAAAVTAPWMDTAKSADERASLLEAQMTEDERLGMVHGPLGMALRPGSTPPTGALGSAGYIPGVPRLGVPALQETDASLGIANPMDVRPGDVATQLPSGLALASTWNPDLGAAAGAMIGSEAWHKGFNVLLAGGVNLARDPRNGRNFEFLGEDPLLAGRMDGQAIKGIESQHVISTIKHFALNDQESQRSFLNVLIAPDAARESDLLAFELAIEDGKPGSVMCGYNRVAGAYDCDNAPLLNQVLKGDWHYPGWVMSDWGAVHTVDAASNGLDQESGQQFDKQVFFDAPLRQAIADGKVPSARLQDMVHRILTSMFANGLFDQPPVIAPIDYAANAKIAQRAAEEGIVLLRNEHALLPLSSTVTSIAVIGGHADRGVISGGGSAAVVPVGGPALTIPLGGDGPMARMRSIMFDPSSPLAAIKAKIPTAKVRFSDGRYPAEAASLAKSTAVAIVFVTQWMMEAYDAPDMSLPEGQDQLIAVVTAANPNTIVVLETGNPVLMPWLAKTRAVVEAWYPGARGGEAISDLLFGDINPSGHLPITFPNSEAQLPRPHIDGLDQPEGTQVDVSYNEGADIGYRWYAKKSLKPLFPFGFGLSYTSFTYSGMTMGEGAVPTVSFTVANTGTRAGSDVPQLYLTSKSGSKTLRLVGWKKLDLKPGEMARVMLDIDPRLLADFDAAANHWHLKSGAYDFALGSSSADMKLRGTGKIADLILPP